ncbi:uncharacterized protein LOC119081323 [Bradysia coprophila]|uniref:uncharacterized protein LOC119081323 n=1 Tax=Bradysia coprophila TaxID=38358 RepID=UPI00187D9E9D|nr:uncharacterized protein LOC119081323 [Bradysia coprophila]
MRAPTIVILSLLITQAKSSESTDRCHTDNDCTGLTKCSSNGFCVISNFKVGILGFVGALLACAILGACVYLNISYVIRKHVQYSEIASKNVQLNEQEKTNVA